MKRFGTRHRVLTGHRVANEENLIRLANFVDLPQFVHRHFIDVQASGGIENDRVEQVLFGMCD